MKVLEFSKKLLLAETILNIFTIIPIIVGNTLVLLATWKEKILHQPNKYFVVCLAFADLLVGLFIGPLRVYLMNLDSESRRSTSIHLCRFSLWIDTLALTASFYTLMFISFDRYLKISKPLQYKSRMTTSKSLKIIFIIWLISTAFATYAATPDSGSTGFIASGGICSPADINKQKGFYTFLLVGVIFLPTMVMIVMYTLIFVVAHKRQKMLRSGELGEGQHRRQRSVLRQDLKNARMLLTVLGVFFLCWFPFIIVNVLNLHIRNIFDWSSYPFSVHVCFVVIFLLPLLNSVCNPLIYACKDQTYREAFKHLLQRMMCKSSLIRQQQGPMQQQADAMRQPRSGNIIEDYLNILKDCCHTIA